MEKANRGLDLIRPDATWEGPQPEPKEMQLTVDIEPQDGWVLVREESLLPEPTKGSKILLPEGDTKASYAVWRVLKCGPGGRMDNGDRWEMPWEPGDRAMSSSPRALAEASLLVPLPWAKGCFEIEESCLIGKVVEGVALVPDNGEEPT